MKDAIDAAIIATNSVNHGADVSDTLLIASVAVAGKRFIATLDAQLAAVYEAGRVKIEVP